MVMCLGNIFLTVDYIELIVYELDVELTHEYDEILYFISGCIFQQLVHKNCCHKF